MIGFMSLEEQVNVDFGRARRRGSWAGWWIESGGTSRVARLRRGQEGVGGWGSRAHNRVRHGRGVVEVSKIVGSVGRWRGFDRRFMPAGASAERWKRVDRAFLRGEELPSISLYKVGERYFVEEGNHRVSVARYHGVEMIEAEITRFRPRLPERVPGRRPACATG